MGRPLSERLEEFFFRPDEDPGPLFEVGAAVEPVAQVPAEQTPEQYVAFALEGETYALPLIALREVVRVPPITEVPRAHKALLGVMNLRGEVLPVYDIKPRLHLAPAEQAPRPKAARVLVVRSEAGDAGLVVDAVSGVVRLKASDIEPPPTGLLTAERDCVVGLGRSGKGLYIVLDVESALV